MFWYDEEVKDLENKSLARANEADTLFYGSSSIRLWESLDEDFKDFKPLNLGFGGATLAACVWFFKGIMAPFRPKRLILYAGDNDLGDGRHPEEVFIFFQQLAISVSRHFGELPCYFISLKPSPSRHHMLNNFTYSNRLIENEINLNQPCWQYIDVFSKMIDEAGLPIPDYFLDDGLHLNKNGYRLWAATINQQLNDRH